MIWINLFLGIIVIILLTSIIRFKYEIRNISKQINSKGQFVNIRTKTLDKDFDHLISSINKMQEIDQIYNIQLKRNEEELRKGIANISHDLRTPLTSIMGYIQLLDCADEEKRVNYQHIIESRTKTLQNLITSFYELSRIESTEYAFTLKSVNIKNILYEAIAMFYNDFEAKNLEPSIIIDEEIPYIIADENAVQRVFINLINNMLKHSHEKIVISLKEVNGHIETIFSNYAPELTENDLEHLFDRFYTADTVRSSQNTGLGLSITMALVEKMGYHIDAKLKDGHLIIKVIW